MSTRYVLNQPVILDVTFTVGGVATDPTTVTLLVTDPAGTATTYTYAGATVTKSSTGVYTKTVTGNLAGTWSYVWTGTGTAADVQDGTFQITQAAPISRAYFTVDQLREHLRDEETTDDATYARLASSVSRWIDLHTKRPMGFGKDATDTQRTYIPTGFYDLRIDDVVSITELATDMQGDGTYETVWQANEYELMPLNPVQYGITWPYDAIRAVATRLFPPRPWGVRQNLVRVTGIHGWPAVPEVVTEAALIQAARVFKRRFSPEGVIGPSDFGVVRVGNRLDPDVAEMLGDLVNHRGSLVGS